MQRVLDEGYVTAIESWGPMNESSKPPRTYALFEQGR